MATRWPQKYPDAPQHGHRCRVAGCQMCDFRQQTRETGQENQIPCSLLFRMVCSVPQPNRTPDWPEFDDLSFMNWEDDSDEKAEEERRINDEFGVNVRDYKLIGQWDEPNFDECPPSPTSREERQLRATPARCPLCKLKIVHQHVSWWRGQKGCMCHVIPGDVCWCGYCILQRNRKHHKTAEELDGEKRRWEEEKKKKTPSEDKLYKKVLEGYEEWRFNKYFLQPTEGQTLNESLSQSAAVLEQTLELETSLNASVRSLFDPNSSVRLLPLYETLPPRSGTSTVPGEFDPVSSTQRRRQTLLNQDITSLVEDDSVTATQRRKTVVSEELARRRHCAADGTEPGSSNAHTEEVRTRVIGETLQDVKRSCSAVKTALKWSNIRKMSKQIIGGNSSQDPLNETVVAAPQASSSVDTSHPSAANPSLNESHHSTANETLDDMSILEALRAAHESIRQQMNESVELAQAVEEAGQAEQAVHELSMNGSFNPEIIHQRRRHMANLRKAAAARDCNPNSTVLGDTPSSRGRPGFIRFDTGRHAYRNILKQRIRPKDAAFPGPGPKNDHALPPMNSWRQNTSIRSNRSMKSNTSANTSYDPAAYHAQTRRQLREALQNATQVLTQTLNTTQAGANTTQGGNKSCSSGSGPTAPAAANQSQNTSQNNTSAATVQQPPRPTSLNTSVPQDESILSESLVNPAQPQFARHNPHYQSHSASTPAAQDRYQRFRTYLANNQINETIVEASTSDAAPENTSMGNAVAGLFQNESRNSTINDSGLNSTHGQPILDGTQQSVRSAADASTTSARFQNLSTRSNNTTINQSVLSARAPAGADTTLTALDDISYMGDVPVPRELSIHDTVGALRQALEASLVQSFYRLTPHYDSGYYGDDTQANYYGPPAQQRSYNRGGSGDGSGIVIEINANPTFVNNPGSGSDSLLAQIESMIMARQRDFEQHMEAMCLRQLEAHFVRPHYGSN